MRAMWRLLRHLSSIVSFIVFRLYGLERFRQDIPERDATLRAVFINWRGRQPLYRRQRNYCTMEEILAIDAIRERDEHNN